MHLCYGCHCWGGVSSTMRATCMACCCVRYLARPPKRWCRWARTPPRSSSLQPTAVPYLHAPRVHAQPGIWCTALDARAVSIHACVRNPDAWPRPRTRLGVGKPLIPGRVRLLRCGDELAIAGDISLTYMRAPSFSSIHHQRRPLCPARLPAHYCGC